MNYEYYKSLLDKTDEYYRMCVLFADWGQSIEHDRRGGVKYQHLNEVFEELERAQRLIQSTCIEE